MVFQVFSGFFLSCFEDWSFYVAGSHVGRQNDGAFDEITSTYFRDTVERRNPAPVGYIQARM